MTDESSGKSDKLLYCSFCGKSQHEVRKLIAGPSVFICDECVDLCNEIIREEYTEEELKERREQAAPPEPKQPEEVQQEFELN